MPLYQKLGRNARQFLSLTGLELSEFQRLLPELEKASVEQEARRKGQVVRTGEARQRRPGAGARYGNELPDWCLMLLLYYRLYVSQEFLTLLFKAGHKSVICRGIQSVRGLWSEVLPLPERMRQQILTAAREVSKERRKRIGSLEEFREAYPELEFLIDGVEQPKRKPQDKQKRRDDYSGKKKRHTRKQIITGTRSGLIVDQSPAVGGRMHDFEAFKIDHHFRAILNQLSGLRATIYADSGFQGIQAIGLPAEMRVVERARRSHPLTRHQRQLNRFRSSQRIAIEHIISRRKKYLIAALEYRNRDQDYDLTMQIVSGLVNLRALNRISQRSGLVF